MGRFYLPLKYASQRDLLPIDEHRTLKEPFNFSAI